MKDFLVTIYKERKRFGVIFLFVLGSFLIGDFARADLGASVASLLGHILSPIIWICGGILLVLMDILIGISQYNDFINASPVSYGWVIVRDICNMFFILIFLVISFATILRIESYNAKKMIPKLVLMAVLINFSKTICGLIIDASQVVMLTFVDSFKAIGAGNLSEILQIDKILDIKANYSSENDEVGFFSVAGSLMLSLIYILISIVVVGALVFTLVIRTVMLWIYIVLSPLAYLLSSFPQGKAYASRWWSEFSKYVIVGPVLAFFIWLSFVSMGGVTSSSLPQGASSVIRGNENLNDASRDEQVIAGLSAAGTPDHMLKYMISIAMLIGGLMVSQQMGGMAGAAAGKAMGYVQSGKNFAVNRSKGAVGGAAKSVGGSAWSGVKAADGLVGSPGTRLVNVTKDAKGMLGGAAAGAAAGSVVPIVGTTMGAIGGAIMGRFADKAARTRETDKELLKNSHEEDKGVTRKGADGLDYNWRPDEGIYRNAAGGVLKEDGKAVGRYGDIKHEGKNYRRMDDNKFYRINDEGRMVYYDKKDEKDKIVVEDKQREAAKSKGNLSLFGRGVALKGNKKGGSVSKFKAHYHSSQARGRAIQEAAENEKIEKEQKNYMGMDDNVLQSLLKTEKDSTKKMAVAMTLGIKNGFKNAEQVNMSKEILKGNGLLMKQFNEAMNKNNMVLNNTSNDGVINEAAITKLVSTGKANWKDQSTKNMTSDALRLMQRHRPNDFDSDISAMAKTDKDKNNLSGKLLETINSSGGASDEIKTAYAKLSGKYAEAFCNDVDSALSSEVESMRKALAGITKITDFNDIDEKDFRNGGFQKAIQSLSLDKIKKIAKSDKMDEEQIRRIVQTYYEGVNSGNQVDGALTNYATSTQAQRKNSQNDTNNNSESDNS